MKFTLSPLFLLSFLLISYNVDGQHLGGQHKCGELVPNESLSIANWGYSYDDLLTDIETWEQSPFVSIQSIGKSVQNRDLWQLKITNNDIPDSGKKIVSIHARTHPNEVQSWWVTNEMINQLLSGNFNVQLLEECVFYIIPMYNPDGVELEHPRENANNIDIESNWNKQIVEPEVAALRSWFLLQMNSESPIDIALNMHSAIACKRYFVYHEIGGTSLAYTELEKKFIGDVVSHAMGGIQNWDYYTSWGNSTPNYYPESWFWLNYGQNVLALTYEDMNCDSAGDYEHTASSILNGIVDNFGINTSVYEIDKELPLFRIYPNPVLDVLFVEFPDVSSILSYSLLDFQGKVILTEKTVDRNLFNIDFRNNFESGIYFLQIKTSSQVVTEKVIFVK